MVDEGSWSCCPFCGEWRKPSENWWFRCWGTSPRVILIFNCVLSSVWTKKFCEGWRAVICEALGFYSVAHVKWGYLEFFGGGYTVFKLAPLWVNISLPHMLRDKKAQIVMRIWFAAEIYFSSGYTQLYLKNWVVFPSRPSKGTLSCRSQGTP